ncbi:hypothetical protein [Isoalcanivorax indicus]|nr:hypothetical protein [Isoalcanivorax indicus]
MRYGQHLALLALLLALAGCADSEARDGDNPTSTPARAALPAPSAMLAGF